MKKMCLALAVVLLMATCGWAELKIGGQLTVPANHLVRLEAQGTPDGSGLIWDFDEDTLDGEEAGSKLYLTGPAGSYKIKLRAVSCLPTPYGCCGGATTATSSA